MRSIGSMLLLAMVTVCSAVNLIEAPPSEPWMQDWQVCGPFALQAPAVNDPGQDHLIGFETDFLKPCGGEMKMRRPCANAGLKWRLFHASDSVVNLDQAVSTADFVVAYAFREWEEPLDRPAILALGSNDGCRVWLNGEQIWDFAPGRGVRPDQDLIPVLLKKGSNRLLLKIEERGNRWGFCLRIRPFDLALLADQDRLFRVRTRRDGAAVLEWLTSLKLLKQSIHGLRCEVSAVSAGEKPIWQAEWQGQSQLVLGAPYDQYDRFLLRMHFRAQNGKAWTESRSFTAGIRRTFTLFENGKSDYVIVLAADASESEKWAGRELQYWLQECGSAELPIITDADSIRAHEIVVGFNRHSQKLLGPAASRPPDADESFCYQNVGPHLLIYGGCQRGTQYGVFSFLERELGCRWYTPRVSLAPLKIRWSFERLHHAERPGIRVRNDFYYEAFDPIWAARNRVNGAMNYREQPGGVEAYWSVHTFYRFLPPEEFFAGHPEYYSLIDGRRIYEHAQLCLTQPDVLRIITERMRKTMQEHPEYLIYCLSQNDWHNPCQCDNCQALHRREESEAGPIVWFVNQVAETLQKEFPDKFIGTLAYLYSRKPPKTIKPRENVVIRLCSIECCFAHDFHSCPENSSFVADLQAWAKLAPHLYIWDYVVNFSQYIMPYPNFKVLQSNIKTFRDNNAIGIMEQAAYQSRGGEFAELRAYVISRLLWNPECDVEEVIDDFIYGYYGRSGQYVRAYFDLLHAQVTADTHIHLGLQPDDPLFANAWLQEAETLFDQAEAVADHETIRQRVEMARLPLWYLKCLRDPVQAREDGSYRRFQEVVEREGITLYAEAGEPHRQAFHKKVENAK